MIKKINKLGTERTSLNKMKAIHDEPIAYIILNVGELEAFLLTYEIG